MCYVIIKTGHKGKVVYWLTQVMLTTSSWPCLEASMSLPRAVWSWSLLSLVVHPCNLAPIQVTHRWKLPVVTTAYVRETYSKKLWNNGKLLTTELKSIWWEKELLRIELPQEAKGQSYLVLFHQRTHFPPCHVHTFQPSLQTQCQPQAAGVY